MGAAFLSRPLLLAFPRGDSVARAAAKFGSSVTVRLRELAGGLQTSKRCWTLAGLCDTFISLYLENQTHDDDHYIYATEQQRAHSQFAPPPRQSKCEHHIAMLTHPTMAVQRPDDTIARWYPSPPDDAQAPSQSRSSDPR